MIFRARYIEIIYLGCDLCVTCLLLYFAALAIAAYSELELRFMAMVQSIYRRVLPQGGAGGVLNYF
jgi:hypothetical protein